MPTFGEGNFPRDFEGWMYLGKFVHFINVGLHRDAERDDLTLGPYFEDRTSKYDARRDETYDEQKLAHQRIGTARATALKAFRDGLIVPRWLDPAGDFRAVPCEAFDATASEHALNAILAKYSLPKSFTPAVEIPVFPSMPALYVPSDQAAALIAEINDRVRLPHPPSKILERLGATAPSNDSTWSLGASIVWVATRNIVLARGAHAYLNGMASRATSPVREGALELLAREELAFHYCHCRKPVCICWDDALGEITGLASVGAVVANGFKNDAGNLEDVPTGAWSGTVKLGECANIEPAKPGGDAWTNISFKTADVLLAFPPVPPMNGTIEVAPAASSCQPEPGGSRNAAILRLAAQLSAEGVPKRDVKMSIIHARWDPQDGKPPLVKELAGHVTSGESGRPRSRKLSRD